VIYPALAILFLALLLLNLRRSKVSKNRTST